MAMATEEEGTNLIINYLPKGWTESELRSLFFQHGNVIFCKVVRNRVTKQSECYGFVRYDLEESAESAIKALNGYQVQNKRLKVAISKPSTKGPEKANLYVAGFPSEWIEENLSELVTPYGTPVETKILYDKLTQKSKRCGFVRMKTYDEATAASRALNGKPQGEGGKPLVVRFADRPRESAARKQLKFAQTFGYPRGMGMGMGMGGPPMGGPPMGGPPMGGPPMGGGPMGGPMGGGPAGGPEGGPLMGSGLGPNNGGQKHPGVCLFIYHLPPSASASDLFQLFSNYGIVMSCKVMKDLSTGLSKGYGFVNMMNHMQAELAIHALNGYRMGTKYLQVSYKT